MGLAGQTKYMDTSRVRARPNAIKRARVRPRNDAYEVCANNGLSYSSNSDTHTYEKSLHRGFAHALSLN